MSDSPLPDLPIMSALRHITPFSVLGVKPNNDWLSGCALKSLPIASDHTFIMSDGTCAIPSPTRQASPLK